MDAEITKDDTEEYIRYTKMLWDEITRQYATPSVGLADIDVPDKIKETMEAAIFSQVNIQVFSQVVETFYKWLTHDDPWTGHKAKLREEEPSVLLPFTVGPENEQETSNTTH